ncbi:hypothetical protein ACLMJK_008302 [Lecanora helva]
MTHWPNVYRPSALFTVTQGQFQLTVSCMGASVPWSIVTSLARKLSLLTGSQFPSIFDAYYMDTSTSIPLWISFRVIGTEAASAISSRPRVSIPHRRELAPPATPASSKRSIIPRANDNPVLHLTKFKKTLVLLPTALAVSRFEDFYDVIALKIETGQFSNWLPSKQILLQMWDWELEITCDKMSIPWTFVQAWAIYMSHMSSQQFTGFYEAVVRGDGPLNGLVFLVRMQTKNQPWNRIAESP